MIIRKEGFILRPLQLSDAQGYWEVMRDEATKLFFNSVPDTFEKAKKEIEDLIAKEASETFTIEVDGEYAGNVRLDHQKWDVNSDEGRVHLWVHPNFRSRGLATEALSALLEYGLKKFRVIYAQCKSSNKAVARVFEKAGFKLEKTHMVDGVEKMWWSRQQ